MRRTLLPRSLLLVATLASVSGLAACDSFGEPDRFYNSDARPPAVGALAFSDIRPGQHVAGTVAFSLAGSLPAAQIQRIEVLVDRETGFSLEPPYSFTIDTRRFPDGEHEISVRIFLARPTGGLLTLAGTPDVLLTSRLVFDQRRPTAVGWVSAELEGERPSLRWTVNRDSTFDAYIVYRRGSRDGSGGLGEEVATIRDRARTTFVDDPLPSVYGLGWTYHVAVSNRADIVATYEPRTVTYGTSISEFYAPGGDAVASADGSEVYLVTGRHLAAVSTATRQVVRSLLLPGAPDIYDPYPEADIHLDPTSGHLFLMPRPYGMRPDRWPLLVINPATFASEQRALFPAGATRFALSGGRVYAVGSTNGVARLHVIDAASGAASGPPGPTLPSATGQVAGASPDGRSVYVVGHDSSGNRSVQRVDVSGDLPQLAERIALPYSEEWDAAVAPDGRLFVSSNRTVRAFGGSPFRMLGQIVLPAGGGPIQDLTLDQGHLYVTSRGVVVPSLPGGGEVTVVEIGSFSLLRTWRFADMPTGTVRGGPGELYVFEPFKTWTVPL